MLHAMFVSLQRLVLTLAESAFAAAAIVCAQPVSAVEPTAPSTASLHEIEHIELPGVMGRIDHLAVDLDGQLLFVAALGADEVEVIDLRDGRRIARLTGFKEPQGVVYVPSLRRLFVAAGESGQVVAFEGNKRVGVVTGLPDADNMRFFAPTGQVVVGYGHGLAFIDPATLAVVRRLSLPGHPEAFELAEHSTAIYVNVPDLERVIVLDRDSGRTTSEWSLGGAASNYPMALDEPSHRLYVGTRHPSKVVSYDTVSGRLLESVPSCGDMDDLFVDRIRVQLLAVCGDGTIDILQGGAPENSKLRRIESSSGARTGLFVPSTRRLYVAAPKTWTSSAQVRVLRAE